MRCFLSGFNFHTSHLVVIVDSCYLATSRPLLADCALNPDTFDADMVGTIGDPESLVHQSGMFHLESATPYRTFRGLTSKVYLLANAACLAFAVCLLCFSGDFCPDAAVVEDSLRMKGIATRLALEMPHKHFGVNVEGFQPEFNRIALRPSKGEVEGRRRRRRRQRVQVSGCRSGDSPRQGGPQIDVLPEHEENVHGEFEDLKSLPTPTRSPSFADERLQLSSGLSVGWIGYAVIISPLCGGRGSR